MVVLGIDPGYAIVGYGAIEHQGMKNKLICCGAITTKAHTPLHLRLAEIYQDTLTLLDQIKPDAVAIEELFFNNNITTGIQVAQARGVILCACAQKGYTPAEYTPSEVKQAVVGYGKATKQQVMEMTRRLLGLQAIPKPDDAADGLAMAICHAHTGSSAFTRLGIKNLR